MEWMNMQWITTFWMPLVIALVIGFILGWLLTGLSPRRKNAEYAAQIDDVQAKSRRTERDLVDARKQVDSLKSDIANGQTTADSLRKQLAAAQEQANTLSEQQDGIDADLQSRNIELADAKMQLAMLHDQVERLQSTASNEIEDLRARYEAAVAENTSMRNALDAAQGQLSKVQADANSTAETAAAREIALNEAYQRAVNLQRVIEDRERLLVETQSELDKVKSHVSALAASKTELEDRLQRARGDVASEMAALTSTMIKMKDDALSSANVRIAELTKQLNELQSKQAAG